MKEWDVAECSECGQTLLVDGWEDRDLCDDCMKGAHQDDAPWTAPYREEE